SNSRHHTVRKITVWKSPLLLMLWRFLAPSQRIRLLNESTRLSANYRRCACCCGLCASAKGPSVAKASHSQVESENADGRCPPRHPAVRQSQQRKLTNEKTTLRRFSSQRTARPL